MASRGDELMQQAEKTLKKFSIFGAGSKYEDACDLFQKAANQFKIAKMWNEAGGAFKRAADCQLKLNNSNEAASFWMEAGNCYMKEDTSKGIELLYQAITAFCEMGRFSTAAKLQKQIAEAYEQDQNHDDAVDAYQKAADYYNSENQPSAANSMLLKVAHYSALKERYDEAIKIYEDIGTSSLDNNLLKFNAKGHFLNAGLCHLAKKDIVSLQQAIQKYKDLDYTFSGSREGKFLEDLAKAFEEYDVDAFTDTVFNYDNISKLDAWKTSLLLKVKETISQAGTESLDLT